MAEEPIDNKTSDDEIEQEQVATRVRSDRYVDFYANFAECGFTAWDIRVAFSLVGVDLNGNSMLTDQASVVVTPAMAKALADILGRFVGAYERQNGEIHMPRSIIEEAQKRKAAA